MKVKSAMKAVKAMQATPPPAAPAPAPVVAAKQAKAKATNARLLRTITVLAATNPKKPSSKAYQRFALYRTGMTVGDYVKAGGRVGDIQYDTRHQFISVS